MKFYLADTKIPDNYSGGTSVTILRDEFLKAFPKDPCPRRLDYSFRKGIPTQVDNEEIALYLIEKYGDRFISVDAECKPTTIKDDLDELNYKAIQRLVSQINAFLKENDEPTLAIAGTKVEHIQRIRKFREEYPEFVQEPTE